MSEVKVKHRGGDKAMRPSIDKKSHPMQMPGKAAEGVKLGKMNWSGKEQK